jgi:DNA sulfur modification protein DndB
MLKMPTSCFEYVLPAIRGIQAGCEYYVSMCPVGFLPKLFPLDDEEMPPQMRARRSLNRSRVAEIGRYILENPQNYTFSAITASIDADIAFEPLGKEAEAGKMGRLRVPMDARFIINDGQHRRAALEMALKENPELGYETIAVILFLEMGIERSRSVASAVSQQIFSDLNRYGVHPDPSLNILYDYRDRNANLVREVIKQVPVFRSLVDTERSTLPARSGKLFTLSSIYNGTLALLENYPDESQQKQVEIAVCFWNAVSSCIPDWQQVLHKKVGAFEIRRDYLHCSAIALTAIGAAGATSISIYPHSWAENLKQLGDIDWSRFNLDWEGQILTGAGVSKSRRSATWMSGYVKRRLGLPLTSEEEELDNIRG